MSDSNREVTVQLKAKVDLAEVLSAIGLLEMVGKLEQAIDRVDRAALAGNKEEWPTQQDWLATAETLRQAWRDEVKAHARTKRELTARIEELQAHLRMANGE